MDAVVDPCPLVSYIEDNPADDLDIDMIREAQEAARSGNIVDIYNFALLLHQLMFDDNIGLSLKDMPKDVFHQTLEQSFALFASAAEQGDPDGMVMTGWHMMKGFGTEKSLSVARMWFDAAAKQLGDDHRILMAMRNELETQSGSGPAVREPVFN